MPLTLSPGANAALERLALKLTFQSTGIPLDSQSFDISAFLLTSSAKVNGRSDRISAHNPQTTSSAIRFDASQRTFDIDLTKLETGIEKVVITLASFDQTRELNVFQELKLTIQDAHTNQALLEAVFTPENLGVSSLILGEFYLRQATWKFRNVAQGFAGGLEPLFSHFGLTLLPEDKQPAKIISQDTPSSSSINIEKKPVAATANASPLTSAPSTPKVSLSKITLDKARPSVDLNKRSQGFGEVKINLNWNQHGTKPKGFLSSLLTKSSSIDLDLGCLYELNDGRKGAVQALGNTYGSLSNPPYIQLLGDDRSGSNQDGEWLHINGQHWAAIKRVLVYAFIYEGVPNWAATDANVTLFVPNEPNIEIQLTEDSRNLNMCGMVLLENVGGALRVSRLMHYTSNHHTLDQTYQWGLNWKAGSK
ncbi:MAG: TerD family protein [Pseudomonadota bacterium]